MLDGNRRLKKCRHRDPEEGVRNNPGRSERALAALDLGPLHAVLPR